MSLQAPGQGTAKPTADPLFDGYATCYEEALARGLVVSGEPATYFAAGRARVVAAELARRRLAAGNVLDFGCGIGGSLRWLADLPGVTSLAGTDPSEASLERARAAHPGVRFWSTEMVGDAGPFGLVWVNGVFHHIPPPERPATTARIVELLAPGGLLALWENNPWNPGARWVMRRIPFDRDAVMLSVREARRLADAAGLEVLATRFAFVFPAWLRPLRRLEGWLAGWPAGAQYVVLARRPAVGRSDPSGPARLR